MDGGHGKVIMKASIIVSAILFIATNNAIAQNLSNDDKMFDEGLKAGMMSKYEGDVVNAYSGLLILQKVDGAEYYRKILVGQMNTALFAMSFVDRDVKVRPDMLRELSEITPTEMKTFMSKLKQARSENRWQSEDAEVERRIQWVLDRYILTGNIYGFE